VTQDGSRRNLFSGLACHELFKKMAENSSELGKFLVIFVTGGALNTNNRQSFHP
jgi:hypothetical protein